MADLLIVNPNTSAGVTSRLLDLARAQAPAGVRVLGATARQGPRYITGEVGLAVGAYAALDAYLVHAREHGRPDAIVLACFGDPGLHALRALAGRPVLGLAEASMQSAHRRGPYVIITAGAAWLPILTRLAGAMGQAQALLGVWTIDGNAGALGADPARATRVLAEAVLAAQARWPEAQSFLLGGAGFAGLAAAVNQHLGTDRVLDNWLEALEGAWSLLAHPVWTATDTPQPAEAGPWLAMPEVWADAHAPAEP